VFDAVGRAKEGRRQARRVKVRVLKVVDGDTVNVALRDPATGAVRRLVIRLADIDTAELTSASPDQRKKALAARTWLAGRVARRGGVLYLTPLGPEKYGRTLGHLFERRSSRSSLNQGLVDAKLALPYQGGKKAAI
jgi:endonuclease YncB( thermonuclease family)